MKRILMVLTVALLMSAFALPEAFGAAAGDVLYTCGSSSLSTTRGPGPTSTVGTATLQDGSFAQKQAFTGKFKDAQCSSSTLSTVASGGGG
jgi:hypothetical protein